MICLPSLVVPGEDISGMLKGKGTGARRVKNKEQKARNRKSRKHKTRKNRNQQQATRNRLQPATKHDPIDISKIEEVVLMPRLSDTMTEGVIASWQKKVGDTVKKGEVIAEIETDKATMELESYKNGTLLYAGAKQGEKIAVNDLLCIIGEKGKVDVDAIVNAAKARVRQRSKEQERLKQRNKEQEKTTMQHGKYRPATQQVSENGRIKASPLAKKLAAEKGIDLHKSARQRRRGTEL